MINDSEQELIRLQSELITHEVQCEERWKTTFNRLEDIEASLLRMENRQMQLGGAVIVFLATLVATMVIQG
jgi:hypothetical protein